MFSGIKFLKMKKTARPLLLFYLLVAYVMMQFIWWAYLLVDLNKESTEYRMEISRLSTETSQHEERISRFEEELEKRMLMVAGEGTVFLALLIFGITRIRSAFYKEIALSRQQRNFILSVTHEFKSPLAAIKLSLQTMQKRELDKVQKETILRRSLSETERIHALVDNVLLAAQLDSSTPSVQLERMDFSTFIKDTVTAYTERPEQRHRIDYKVDSDIHIRGDDRALTSLLFNLIENAEKYSPEGTLIQVSLTGSVTAAKLMVSDQGSGIPEKERERVFEKFYRVGNEDTRQTKGTGLGLFIVRHIVQQHKGQIRIRNNEPSGTIFEITLPVDN